MPEDATLAWLLENDPSAAGLSRREYSKRIGVTTPQTESDINEHEITFTDIDVLRSGHHCKQCRCKSATSGATVE